MAEHTRAYALENPKNVRERAETRRSREVAAGPCCSASDITHLRNIQNDRCAYCDADLHSHGHIDHMTPVANGGSNAIENLALACYQCNTEKHAKTAHEYFGWRSRLGLPVYTHVYAYRLIYGH